MELKDAARGARENSFSVAYPIGALLFVGACLALEHFDGGVVSHHLLNSADMPAFSNWWGLLTLPLLGVLFASRAGKIQSESRILYAPSKMLMAFVGALIYGAMLSIAFTLDAESIRDILFFGLILISIILPVYRIEYAFGFVVGMTYTFGGVLPVVFAIVFGALSFISRWIFMSAKSLIVGNKN